MSLHSTACYAQGFMISSETSGNSKLDDSDMFPSYSSRYGVFRLTNGNLFVGHATSLASGDGDCMENHFTKMSPRKLLNVAIVPSNPKLTALMAECGLTPSEHEFCRIITVGAYAC